MKTKVEKLERERNEYKTACEKLETRVRIELVISFLSQQHCFHSLQLIFFLHHCQMYNLVF
jgi:hypothetical protein